MNITLAELINCEAGLRYLIPWKWLSTSSRKTLEIIFAVYFDHEQDFSRGFSIHHLSLVSVNDAKAIRYLDPRKVNNLVDEVQKIVRNKQYLELPTLDDEREITSTSKVHEYEIFDDLIRKATNLDDISDAILERLSAEFELSERNLEIVRARVPWYSETPLTLEAIGKEYGITRERIRQITKKYEEPQLILKGEIRFLTSVIKIAEQSNDLDEFVTKCIKAGLGDENFSFNQCSRIFEIFKETEQYAFFDELIGKMLEKEEELDEVSKLLSGFRSKMGFINLGYAAIELQLSLDQIKASVLQKYPRAVIFNDLALARTSYLATTFESTIAKQLIYNPKLTNIELLEGVIRFSTVRKDSLSGEKESYLAIINILCGDPINAADFIEQLNVEVELSDTDTWFVGLFNEAPDKMLHRVEITRQAIESGMNLGSLSVYLNSNPLVRSLSNGIFSLAGNIYDKDEISAHAQLALAQDKQSQLDYDFDGSNIQLNLIPSLSLFSSGVIPSNRVVKDLFQDSTFAVECTCGECKSVQMIKLEKNGFWMGFSSLLNHGLVNHNFGIGDMYKIYFDFERQVATLKIDAK